MKPNYRPFLPLLLCRAPWELADSASRPHKDKPAKARVERFLRSLTKALPIGVNRSCIPEATRRISASPRPARFRAKGPLGWVRRVSCRAIPTRPRGRRWPSGQMVRWSDGQAVGRPWCRLPSFALSSPLCMMPERKCVYPCGCSHGPLPMKPRILGALRYRFSPRCRPLGPLLECRL